MTPTELAGEFPQDDDIVYLNHAAVAPWPARAATAAGAFARENIHRGAADYPAWLRCEQLLRRQIRDLVNAPGTDEIALVKNTSEALSFVAHGLQWQSGENVVTSNLEFPSNRIVWESLARHGVEIRIADVAGSADPEAAMIAQLDARTRLLAVSSVQFGTGLRMDLPRLGAACRTRDVLFCVDAIQSIGALQFDVQACAADFAMADGHKWMLGPEGLGLFFVRNEVMDQLQLNEFGWHMVEDHGNFDRTDWEVARSARRFECGSGNLLGTHVLSASLSLLLEVGMDKVEQGVLENRNYLAGKLAALPGVEVLSPTPVDRQSGILTFRSNRLENTTLFQGLKDRGVICAQRGGGVRFAAHFYQQQALLDRAVELAAEVLNTGA